MQKFGLDLQRLYIAYFGRPADPIGLAYWNDQILTALNKGYDSPSTIKSISAAFSYSQEYIASTTNMSAEQKVSQLYINLFGREPDRSGLEFWSNFSTSNTHNFADVVKILTGTGEGLDITDLNILNNKATAAAAFTEALNTTEEIKSYSAKSALGLGKRFVSNVCDDASLLAAISSLNLDNYIRIVTDAGDFSPNSDFVFSSKLITQDIANFLSNRNQKIDLGFNLTLHSQKPFSYVEGLNPPGLLSYTIDNKGVLTFSGSLVNFYTVTEKAAIIETIFESEAISNIFDRNSSKAVFYRDGADVYIFGNNGIGSSGDHLVKLKDIASNFLGGTIINGVISLEFSPTSPSFSSKLTYTDTDVILWVNTNAQLSYSISGAFGNIPAGNFLLSPTASLQEGFLTANGISVSDQFFTIGTNAGLTADYRTGAIINRTIILGLGNDSVESGDGNDIVYGGLGNDIIGGNSGNDIIHGGDGNDTLYANQGNDTVYGDDGIDIIQAGQGDDNAYGGAGNDKIDGGSTGNDFLTGNEGSDGFYFNPDSGFDTVTDFNLSQADYIALSRLVSGTNIFTAFNGQRLANNDFDAVSNVSNIRSDTGGANQGNGQVFVVTNGQSTAQIFSAITLGSNFAYAVIYDNNKGYSGLYYDADWSDTAGRTEIVKLIGLSEADLSLLTRNDFLISNNVGIW